jgi:hypothetical protein
MAPMASIAAEPGDRTRPGTKGSRYPTRATASAGSVEMVEKKYPQPMRKPGKSPNASRV